MSKKVALVLSSGGARGLAHVGVIESLLENDYEITSIAGCSIGSIVAGFYAGGKLDEYREWVCQLDRMDVFNLIDFTFSANGFIKGEKIFKTLEQKIMSDLKIEDLRIPYSAIATNVEDKKEVIFEKGSLYQAMKASAAIPTVIKPVKVNGHYYIDGGVTNPIPISYVKRMDGDILVVSSVNGIFPYEKPKMDKETRARQEETYQKIQKFMSKWSRLLPGTESESKNKLGFFDLLNNSIDLMQDKLTSLLMEKFPPDIKVEVSRNICGTFEFYKAEELIKAGKRACSKALKEID